MSGSYRDLPGFIMCRVERMATEGRTFLAFDHWRFLSTHTVALFAEVGEEGRLEPEIWKLSEW